MRGREKVWICSGPSQMGEIGIGKRKEFQARGTLVKCTKVGVQYSQDQWGNQME